MFHDLVRQIQAVRVFDQCPARLAARRIPSHGNVIFKVGDDASGPVASLDCDSFEEEVHGVDESLLRSRGAFGYEAGPVTKRRLEWSARLICGWEMQTFSSIYRRGSWDRMCGAGSRWS